MKTIETDLEMATKFIQAMHGQKNFWLQTFDDSDLKRKELTALRYGSIEQLLALAYELNLKGAGVFIPPNEIGPEGRKASNTLGVNAVWADCDTPNTPWPELGPKPHIVIESSPDKFHLYWLIKDCPLDQFRPIQKCIARMYKSDPTVSDLSRVMRLPGFLHQKGEPFLCRIVEWNVDD